MSRVQPGMPEHKGLADRIKSLEAQVARLNRARSMQSTSLDGGTFRVKGGGTIEILDGSGNVIHQFDVDGMTVFEADGSTLMELDGTGIVLNDGSGTKLIDLTTAGLRAYEADGSTMMVLDESKLRFNRSDGSRQLEITPAGGLKIYDTDGTTEKVVLDSDGLQVIGGFVTPIWPFRDNDSAANVLTGTFTTHTSVTINPPSWVETLYVMASHRLEVVTGTDVWGSALLLVNSSTLTGSPIAAEADASTEISRNADSVSISFAEVSANFPVTIEGQGRIVDGSASADGMRLDVIAFGIRDG